MIKKGVKGSVYFFCFCLTVFLVLVNLYPPAGRAITPGFIFKVMAAFALPLFLKYALYLILAPWYRVITHLRLARTKDRAFAPRVSVLIPAWNEEVGIVNTIRSVADSDYPDLEIIVINDGSTDNTDGKIREYLASPEVRNGRVPVVYLAKENGGKASALNEGIARSSGEIIVTIDADSVVEANTISHFVPYFRDPEVMSVAGHIKVANTRTVLGVVQHLEFMVTFYLKKVESIMNCVHIVGGAAAAYRKEIFKKTGVFNADSITEDIDLSLRILLAGGKIQYAEDAVVYTEGAETFDGLLKQRVRWKRGRYNAFYKYRRMFFNPGGNKLLGFIVLPFSLFSEIKLFFESLFLVLLLGYSIYTLNFTVFLMGAIISSTIFLVKSLFFRDVSRLNLFPFVFIGWLLFYIAAFIEHLALLKTLRIILTRENLEWQVWQRRGIVEDEEL